MLLNRFHGGRWSSPTSRFPIRRTSSGGRGAKTDLGGEIPTGPHGRATRGVHRGRGGRGRGSIPTLSIPTSRSLDHETPQRHLRLPYRRRRLVPSSSSSRTIPNMQFRSTIVDIKDSFTHEAAPPNTDHRQRSPQYDVRAGLEVTGPPRAPQRIGMEPPHVHEIPIRLIANDTELHPSHFCARRMTKVFKRWMIPEGYCWKSVPPHHKDQYWSQWKVFFRWDDTSPKDLIRATYDKLAGIRYTALMHKLKKNRVQPVYVIDEAWRRYLEYWESEDFLARSSQATANRNTEVEGLGTGPSKHDGGSVSFVTTQERLNDSSETPPTVNELYLHLHTVNHDRMTFIDTRSERFYRRCQELTQATPDQSVDDEAVYLNVVGECPKGRVYGLGSLGRKKRRYVDLGASTSEMPDMVPRAEFNVVLEQLRKVMEFMQRTSRDEHGRSRPISATTTTTATS
ncbi:hypothetical protein Sjap_025784 [Stephania japonica]|uniref:Transposase n=1 Tax=Stephania japonica TaxID=461633 RepID=A0AAP0EA50_9MAGN